MTHFNVNLKINHILYWIVVQNSYNDNKERFMVLVEQLYKAKKTIH